MAKLLSISIAAYNVENFLKGTLDSLLADEETLAKMEVIVVNDGSKDRTAEITRGYCERYPESFQLIDKENGGYGSTINSAVRVASGKYFRLLDGDDWYFTENLKDYVEFLEKTEADMVLSPYVEYHEDTGVDKMMDPRQLECFREYQLESLEAAGLDDTKMHEMAVKTELLKRADIRITEHCFYTDTEYVFQAFMQIETIVKYDKPIYRYRVGSAGQSVSVAGRLKHSKDAEKVLDKMVAFYIEGKDFFPEKKRKVLWKTIKVAAWFQYTTYLLFEENKESIANLKHYEKKLKMASKTLYEELGRESKIIAMLRLTGYKTYGIARKRVMSYQ